MLERRQQREAATAAHRPGAATAHLTFARQVPGPLARLEEEEAAVVMQTKPSRLPDLVLQSPHEAAPAFHEDWTLVPGSADDAQKWEQEPRLRDQRNRMIKDYLVDGRSVFRL